MTRKEDWERLGVKKDPDFLKFHQPEWAMSFFLLNLWFSFFVSVKKTDDQKEKRMYCTEFWHIMYAEHGEWLMYKY